MGRFDGVDLIESSIAKENKYCFTISVYRRQTAGTGNALRDPFVKIMLDWD